MYAQVGDRIVVCSDSVVEFDRTGEVTDVRRTDGHPPYLIRWDHDGNESLVFPASNAFFMHRSSSDFA